MLNFCNLLIAVSAKERHNWSTIDCADEIRIVLAIARVFDVMIAGSFSEWSEPRSIEVDAIGVNEVRIFAVIHATRLKPDLVFLVIYAIYCANHPFTFRNLAHLPTRAIHHVEMCPTVTFRHPDNLFAVRNVVA